MRKELFKTINVFLLIMAIVVIVTPSTVLADELTNEDDIETTSIDVLFKWDDLDNAFNSRPDSMVAELYADGDKVASRLVSSDTWRVSFDNLPVREDGRIIKYTVAQSLLPNVGEEDEYIYVGTETGLADADFVITNRYRQVTVDTTRKTISTIADNDSIIDNQIENNNKYISSNNADDTNIDMLDNNRLDDTPQTSDMHDMSTYLCMMLLSLVGIVLVSFKIKKEAWN